MAVFGRVPLRVQLPVIVVCYIGSAIYLDALGMTPGAVYVVTTILTFIVAVALVRVQRDESERTDTNWYNTNSDRRLWPLVIGGVAVAMISTFV